jgi:hypothetical protein
LLSLFFSSNAFLLPMEFRFFAELKESSDSEILLSESEEFGQPSAAGSGDVVPAAPCPDQEPCFPLGDVYPFTSSFFAPIHIPAFNCGRLAPTVVRLTPPPLLQTSGDYYPVCSRAFVSKTTLFNSISDVTNAAASLLFMGPAGGPGGDNGDCDSFFPIGAPLPRPFRIPPPPDGLEPLAALLAKPPAARAELAASFLLTIPDLVATLRRTADIATRGSLDTVWNPRSDFLAPKQITRSKSPPETRLAAYCSAVARSAALLLHIAATCYSGAVATAPDPSPIFRPHPGPPDEFRSPPPLQVACGEAALAGVAGAAWKGFLAVSALALELPLLLGVVKQPSPAEVVPPHSFAGRNSAHAAVCALLPAFRRLVAEPCGAAASECRRPVSFLGIAAMSPLLWELVQLPLLSEPRPDVPWLYPLTILLAHCAVPATRWWPDAQTLVNALLVSAGSAHCPALSLMLSLLAADGVTSSPLYQPDQTGPASGDPALALSQHHGALFDGYMRGKQKDPLPPVASELDRSLADIAAVFVRHREVLLLSADHAQDLAAVRGAFGLSLLCAAVAAPSACERRSFVHEHLQPLFNFISLTDEASPRSRSAALSAASQTASQTPSQCDSQDEATAAQPPPDCRFGSVPSGDVPVVPVADRVRSVSDSQNVVKALFPEQSRLFFEASSLVTSRIELLLSDATRAGRVLELQPNPAMLTAPSVSRGGSQGGDDSPAVVSNLRCSPSSFRASAAFFAELLPLDTPPSTTLPLLGRVATMAAFAAVVAPPATGAHQPSDLYLSDQTITISAFVSDAAALMASVVTATPILQYADGLPHDFQRLLRFEPAALTALSGLAPTAILPAGPSSTGRSAPATSSTVGAASPNRACDALALVSRMAALSLPHVALNMLACCLDNLEPESACTASGDGVVPSVPAIHDIIAAASILRFAAATFPQMFPALLSQHEPIQLDGCLNTLIRLVSSQHSQLCRAFARCAPTSQCRSQYFPTLISALATTCAWAAPVLFWIYAAAYTHVPLPPLPPVDHRDSMPPFAPRKPFAGISIWTNFIEPLLRLNRDSRPRSDAARDRGRDAQNVAAICNRCTSLITALGTSLAPLQASLFPLVHAALVRSVPKSRTVPAGSKRAHPDPPQRDVPDGSLDAWVHSTTPDAMPGSPVAKLKTASSPPRGHLDPVPLAQIVTDTARLLLHQQVLLTHPIYIPDLQKQAAKHRIKLLTNGAGRSPRRLLVVLFLLSAYVTTSLAYLQHATGAAGSREGPTRAAGEYASIVNFCRFINEAVLAHVANSFGPVVAPAEDGQADLDFDSVLAQAQDAADAPAAAAFRAIARFHSELQSAGRACLDAAGNSV